MQLSKHFPNNYSYCSMYTIRYDARRLACAEKLTETANFASGAAIWRTGPDIRVVFYSGPFAPLCENMTSSTKSKVHTVLHCSQRRSHGNM